MLEATEIALSYPAYDRDQEKRLSKQIPIQKTEAQKWLRRLSGEPATVEVEQQVLDLLNGLIRDPEKITLQSSPLKSDSEEPTTLQRELEEAMEQQPMDEDIRSF